MATLYNIIIKIQPYFLKKTKLSIFKTKGIILKIKKIGDKNFLYTIFTKDYGKIMCNTKIAKKEKTLDLGYIINFEIYTKENVSIHKIRNIKILSEYNRDNKTFSELNNYLILLGILANKIPNGSPIYEIFNIIETINIKYNEIQFILIKLKIVSILGDLNENYENKTISKILKFINSNNIERIIKLIGINDEIKNELEKI